MVCNGLQWFAMVDLTGRASAQAEVYVSEVFSDCIATMFSCIECFNSMLWRAMTGRRTAERYGDIWSSATRVRRRRRRLGGQTVCFVCTVTRRIRRVLSQDCESAVYRSYTTANHVLVAAGSRRSCRYPVGLYLDICCRQPLLISGLPDLSLAPTPTFIQQGFMPAQR